MFSFKRLFQDMNFNHMKLSFMVIKAQNKSILFLCVFFLFCKYIYNPAKLKNVIIILQEDNELYSRRSYLVLGCSLYFKVIFFKGVILL